MQAFLSICQKLGLDQTTLRERKLRASIPSGMHDTLLFLICGYDFIFYPSDQKFNGIRSVFIESNGAVPLNLYPNCLEEFESTLRPRVVHAAVEGTGWKEQRADKVITKPGMQVTFSPDLLKKPIGVRDGGVGNYNLQTKALEVIVTHDEGLNKDSALDVQLIPTLLGVFALPPGPKPGQSASAIRHAEMVEAQFMDDMRDAVRPYWGAEIVRLGL